MIPFYLTDIIDSFSRTGAVQSDSMQWLLLLGLGSGAIYAAGSLLILDSVERTLLAAKGAALQNALDDKERPSGEISAIVLQDAQKSRDWWVILYLFLPSSLVSFTVAAVALFKIDSRALLVVLSVCLIFAAISVAINIQVIKLSKTTLAQNTKANEVIIDILEGRSSVVGASLKSKLRNIALVYLDRVRFYSFRAGLIGLLILPVSFTLQPAIVCFTLLISRNGLTPGTVVAVLMYSGLVASPISQLCGQLPRFGEATASRTRLLKYRSDVEDSGFSSDVDKNLISPDSYASRSLFAMQIKQEIQSILQLNASGKIKVSAEDTIIVVHGPSGSGKTTLFASLLHRLEQQGLGDSVAVLDQEASTWGLQCDELLLANQTAGSSEDLGQEIDLLNKLEVHSLGSHNIRERSSRALSTGERRRLGIARTLLSEKPIILLDEPFAGLDDHRKSLVLSAIRSYAKDHVVLLGLHDVETIR